MSDLTRREFVEQTARWGIALGAAGTCLDVLEAFSGRAAVHGHDKEVDRRYYTTLTGDRTQCFICPLNCVLEDGQTCFCRTRQNMKGRLISHAYGNPCIVSLDPVEKLPLAHFLPGTDTLALGVGGCNLRCQYCQNWRESQYKPAEVRNMDLPTAEAVESSRQRSVPTLAYTYTEPVAFWEYCLDLATVGREKGLRNVAATALSINPDPLREWCKMTDAFAVTLKGFDETFYEKVIGSRLAPVLRGLEVIREEGTWLEIISLMVPGYNDDFDKVRQMCRWIRGTLGAQVPLHFGRFVPEYHMKSLFRTPVTTLERCREIGLDEGLEYVYIFNLSPHPGNNTFCAHCGKEVITRLGFKVLGNQVRNGRCGYCNDELPGVWA